MDVAVKHEFLGPIQLELHAQELGQKLRFANPTGKTYRNHLLQFKKDVRLIEASHRTASKWAAESETHSPVVEWLLDNYPAIRDRIRDVYVHLPRKFFSELPRLEDGPPRIQVVAEELILHSDASLDDSLIIQFVNNVQEGCELTIGECWALGTFLKLGLIERLRFICSDMERDYHSSKKTQVFLAQLEKAQTFDRKDLRNLDDHSSLIELHLAACNETGLPTSLKADVRSLIQSKGLSLEEIQRIEQQRLAACQVSIGNVITSLRLLDELDWPGIFEQVNGTERVLRNDPSKIYEKMDFQSRNQYRAAIEELSANSGLPESSTARLALQQAQQAYASGQDSRDPRSHIGYWLIDRGRSALVTTIEHRPRLRRRVLDWITDHPNTSYLGSAFLVTTLMLALLAALLIKAQVLMALVVAIVFLAIIPVSEIIIQTFNAFWTQFIPVKILPKLELAGELPAQHPTIVVVPSMLSSERDIKTLLSKLENHFLANAEPGLKFALLSDFVDAESESVPNDDQLVQLASDGIEELNDRYRNRNGERPFFLFHRRRTWNDAEGKWMGWERKRGKLAQFGQLLNGEGKNHFVNSVGDLPALQCFADSSLEPFVITLDADTILPRDAARKLIGALAHPLNRPQFDTSSRMVTRGYGIVQPRVSIQMTYEIRSFYNWLFATGPGIDPYVSSASDIYQDIYNEGSFVGKGIYDLRAFEFALESRFPDNRILSHDLIEGCYVRAAYASDIEVFDSFPQRYDADCRRQHRWTRGDWQIAAWLRKSVPTQQGCRANCLSLLSRWKIFDNLRRSLVPILALSLLLAGLSLNSIASLLVTSVATGVVFWPSVLSAIFGLKKLKEGLTDKGTDRRGYLVSYGEDLGRSLVRSVFNAAMLPHRAWLMADAILRTLWRLGISQRSLLEWETALTAEERLSKRNKSHILKLVPAALLGILLSGLAIYQQQFWLLPWSCLWILSPLIGHVSSLSRTKSRAPFPAANHRFLLELFSSTWGYFERFVDPATNPLPPDNFQETPAAKIAYRISPTNEGLYLVSALTARHFGFLSHQQLVSDLERNLEIWLALERHNGHHFNWYDSKSGRALPPRYVSTVDSGNLLACYLTLAEGIQIESHEPIVGKRHYGAAIASIDWLQRVTMPMDADFCNKLVELRDSLSFYQPSWRWLSELQVWLEESFLLIDSWSSQFSLAKTIATETASCADAVAIAQIVANRFRNLQNELALVMPRASSDTGLVFNLEEVTLQREKHFPATISLAELAKIDLSSHNNASSEAELVRAPAFSQAILNSSTTARQLLDRYEKIQLSLAKETSGMQFEFLYDQKRKLFSIGFNAETLQRDKSFYDMLASECRLSSFLAIAKGDVKTEHWFRLGRQSTEIDGRFGLLSWGGTMFEFLMPNLFQRAYPDSILERSCVTAIRRQIQYGQSKGNAWGVSESAYNARANNSDYHYKSFGVPGLGLKRGLARDYVVSPYSSILALSFAPQEVLLNLAELSQFALGAWGFYDAVDFTKSRLRKGESRAVVRNYMAHHHGMSILSIANALDASIVQRWFHASPLVRAAELLLQEKSPVIVTIDKPEADDIDESIVRKEGEAIFARRIRGYRASPPKTIFLSNRRAHLMLTHTGGSYFRWNDIQVTRWRPDITRDHWGTHIYLRDLDSGKVWSAAYQPTRIEPDEYEAHFSVDKGTIRHRQGTIETTMEVTVSPEHDAEVRLLRIANLGADVVNLDVTSFAEIALVNERSDLAHPAFYKLFVETEFVAEDNSIVATRRSQDNRDNSLWAVHTIAVSPAYANSIQFDSSRESFLGRGRTSEAPAGMEQLQLAGNAGPVIDPAFVLRCTVAIMPGDSVLLGFTTACAKSREEVLAIADHYQELRGVQRAFELAWAQSQIELQHLNLSAREFHVFQRLGGSLIYPNRALRGDAAKIAANRLGQSSLWRFGISGDHPLILARITSDQDVLLAEQLLIACQYLVGHGVKLELVLCNDFPGSYLDEIQVRLQALVEGVLHGEDVTKLVFILRGAQLTREDHQLLDAVATIVVRGDKGNLADQLEVAPFRFSQSPRPLRNEKRLSRIARNPLTALTALTKLKTDNAVSAKVAKLAKGSKTENNHLKNSINNDPNAFDNEGEFANGFGSFDAGAYQISVSGDRMTPAPWSNVLSNPEFGCLVTESGSGYTWYKNSRENKISTWSNDPTSDPPSEVLFLYDLDSEQLWSPQNLLSSQSQRRVEHRPGESIFYVTENDIDSETSVSVDWNNPIKTIRLKLHNRSSKIRRLRVTYCVETVMGVNRESTTLHQHSTNHTGEHAIVMRNGYHGEFPAQIAFLASRQSGCRFTGDRTEFLDPFGSYRSPAGAVHRLSNTTGAALDPCLAIQCDVELQADQILEIDFYLGAADDDDHLNSLLSPIAVKRSGHADSLSARDEWSKLLNGITIETPNRSMDILFNDWLLYQTLACRIWARSAFYQSGGAFGFRDQLQDTMALVYRRPDLTRQHILLSASRQYTDGSVQHWWHPTSGKGTKTRFSDDFLFLPFAVCHYCTVTGDLGILDELIPFIESLPLMDHEQERYEQPATTELQAFLLEHCKRALLHGMRYGQHRLPLMGSGDWNDGMNRIGEAGKGESVWVGWFQVQVFRDFAKLLEIREPSEAFVSLLRNKADEITEAIETQAWDGQWYRRAFFDDGTSLGGSDNEECQIDSLTQSWSVIVNGLNARTHQAFSTAVERLFDRENKLLMLFTPPFDHEERKVGYIQGYLPGVRENGGQYTHAALWMVSAAAKMGDGELAVELFNAINPIHHSDNEKAAERYRLEPYVVAADVYSNAQLKGRGGWSWYTGSAGWMYRVLLEDILGLQFVDGTVFIRPAVPDFWTHFKIKIVRNETTWNVVVHLAPEGDSTTTCEALQLKEDGKMHEVSLRVHNKRPESILDTALPM